MKSGRFFVLTVMAALVSFNANAYETMREFSLGGSFGLPGTYVGGHMEWTNLEPSGFGFRHGPTFLWSGKDEVEIQGVTLELDPSWRVDYLFGAVYRFGQQPRKGFFPSILPTAVLGVPLTYGSLGEGETGYFSVSARLGGEIYIPIGLKNNGYSNLRYKLFGLALYADYPIHLSLMDNVSNVLASDIEGELKRMNLVFQLKFNFGRRK